MALHFDCMADKTRNGIGSCRIACLHSMIDWVFKICQNRWYAKLVELGTMRGAPDHCNRIMVTFS